jgi:hypothetical protein
MIYLAWGAFKATKDANPSSLIYYAVEAQYRDGNPANDVDRYNLNMSVGGIEYYCFITIESPPSADQTDWETNYKPNAIEN